MKTLELPGLNPAPKSKLIQMQVPTQIQTQIPTQIPTQEEKPAWVWCPPAFDVELDYQHPDFPKKFINRQLLVKNCRKPENDGGWKLYESYFLDELESRKINISRKKIREIIERFYDDKI